MALMIKKRKIKVQEDPAKAQQDITLLRGQTNAANRRIEQLEAQRLDPIAGYRWLDEPEPGETYNSMEQGTF